MFLSFDVLMLRFLSSSFISVPRSFTLTFGPCSFCQGASTLSPNISSHSFQFQTAMFYNVLYLHLLHFLHFLHLASFVLRPEETLFELLAGHVASMEAADRRDGLLNQGVVSSGSAAVPRRRVVQPTSTNEKQGVRRQGILTQRP